MPATTTWIMTESRLEPPTWLEIYAVLFAGLGAVATFGWLYLPGRDLSSLSGYFYLWHHPVIAMALLIVGSGLAFLADDGLGVRRSRWVRTSRTLTRISVGAALLFSVIVPVVIWIVKLTVVVVGLWLLANLKRIFQGRMPLYPRSLSGVLPWVRQALKYVPFG